MVFEMTQTVTNEKSPSQIDSIEQLRLDLVTDSEHVRLYSDGFKRYREILKKRKMIRKLSKGVIELTESKASDFEKAQVLATVAANTQDKAIIAAAEQQLAKAFAPGENPDANQIRQESHDEYLLAIQTTDAETSFTHALIGAENAIDRAAGRSFEDVIARTEEQGALVREQDDHRHAKRQRMDDIPMSAIEITGSMATYDPFADEKDDHELVGAGSRSLL